MGGACAKRSVREPVRIDPSKYDGLSPEEKLHAAACDDNVELLEEIAAEGEVDLDCPRDGDALTALDSCAWSGCRMSSRALLRLGADPAKTVQAVCGLATWGHAELLEVMLEKGGNPGQEYSNYSALRWTLEYGHEDCAMVLLKHGALDVEEDRTSVLRCARQAKMKTFLQKVIETKPELADECRITCLDRCELL